MSRRSGVELKLIAAGAASIRALAFATAAAALGDSIALKSEASFDGQAAVVEIRLADLAELDGPDAEALADVVILTGAARPHELTVQDLRRALRAEGVNLGAIAISGNRLNIDWRSAKLAPEPASEPKEPALDALRYALFADAIIAEDTIRGHIARHLINRSLQRETVDVELSFDKADPADRSTAGLTVEILPQGTLNGPRLPLLINLYHEQRLVDSIRIVIGVRVRENVIIALQNVSRGERLTTGALKQETRLIAPHPTPLIRSVDDAVGAEVAGRIVEGQILRDGDLVPPIAIQRNQECFLRLQSGQFIVRMSVRALEDGRVGEIIRVRRLTDREEFMARVDVNGELIAENL